MKNIPIGSAAIIAAIVAIIFALGFTIGAVLPKTCTNCGQENEVIYQSGLCQDCAIWIP